MYVSAPPLNPWCPWMSNPCPQPAPCTPTASGVSRHHLCVSSQAHTLSHRYVSQCSYDQPPWTAAWLLHLCLLSSLSPILTHPSPSHLCMTWDCLFTGILYSPDSKTKQIYTRIFERKQVGIPHYPNYCYSPTKTQETKYYIDNRIFLTLQICYSNSHYLYKFRWQEILYFCSVVCYFFFLFQLHWDINEIKQVQS